MAVLVLRPCCWQRRCGRLQPWQINTLKGEDDLVNPEKSFVNLFCDARNAAVCRKHKAGESSHLATACASLSFTEVLSPESFGVAERALLSHQSFSVKIHLDHFRIWLWACAKRPHLFWGLRFFLGARKTRMRRRLQRRKSNWQLGSVSVGTACTAPNRQEEKLNKVRVRQILIRFWSGCLTRLIHLT